MTIERRTESMIVASWKRVGRSGPDDGRLRRDLRRKAEEKDRKIM
jgi:hypothetical protein